MNYAGAIPVLLRGVAWPALTAVTSSAVVLGGIGAGLEPNEFGQPLLTAAFALLAAAAALTLDETASAVVDVTPTGLARRTAVRSCSLAVPLAAGVLIAAAASARSTRLPEAALLIAMVGNVLVGFAAACVARRRVGEPGVWAATAVIVALVIPPQFGPVARHIHTFPAPAQSTGLSSNAWWLEVIAASLLAVAVATHHGT